jgi:carbon storage regulator
MLVLSQKLNDTIKIGDNITIKILDIRQDSVRIGVDAPREISVHRQVVYDKLKGSGYDRKRKHSAGMIMNIGVGLRQQRCG